MRTNQQAIFEQSATAQPTMQYITLGIVVDTNDPQQMGRVRVVCSQWGDAWGTPVEDLPWALYMSPIGGRVQTGTRGPGIQTSDGSVAYGMWAIPKVGSQVAVLCIDGNPMTRMYIGCVYDQFTPHTLPHGRFIYDDHPGLDVEEKAPKPHGPYTSTEKLIQPLAQNMKQAFGNVNEPNFEFRSRGADYCVSRVDVSQLSQTSSGVQDDKDITHDRWISTQGYQVSRTDPEAASSYTDKNYDSHVYSFTSPGFHSLSMDDRQENCRVRLRTTSGHQIILDDTNERIYIATATGDNWIELDQNGNIDVFTTNKLNIRAAREINMTSDETIRLYGKKGVHIKSDDEVRVDATKDIHIKASQNIRSHSAQSTHVQADAALHIKSGSVLNLQSGATTNILAGGNIIGTGSLVHFNGPAAESAAPAAEQPALWTNRVPTHEPFARTMTKTDETHEPEFPYNDARVNRIERGQTTDRGMYWRR